MIKRTFCQEFALIQGRLLDISPVWVYNEINTIKRSF